MPRQLFFGVRGLPPAFRLASLLAANITSGQIRAKGKRYWTTDAKKCTRWQPGLRQIVPRALLPKNISDLLFQGRQVFQTIPTQEILLRIP
jgi:hypothetical protein